MRIATLLAAGLFGSALLAQTIVTTGPGNAMQTYYSLQNGVVASHALAEWDLAFELTGITGSILLNTAKGHKLYKAPYTLAQWGSIDTVGLAASWPPQQNSETNWSSGAFNQGLTANPFDLGWGIYNFQTHNIVGDSCFVMHLSTGEWKKFKVDGFTAASNSFGFTWSNLDGSDEQSGSLVRSAYPGKNFGYYNLATNSALDLEPAAASWDLLFTKYLGFVTQPFPAHYPVAGVLQNRQVEALQVDGVPTADAQWWGETFSTDINVIGFDWKTFNQGTFQWEFAQDRTYFVKDRSGNIWKLVFTGYGGSANGNFIFNQELSSATAIAEAAPATVLVHPNPAAGGHATLLVDAPMGGLFIDLMDRSGRMVRQQRVMSSGLVRADLDLSGVPAGIYLVRLHGEGVNATARLAVE